MAATALLLSAAQFAAAKHRDQRRKDRAASPYINHPIAVATLLATVGGVTDVVTLAAALLHDSLEDTDTSPEELEAAFGTAVRQLVEEMTDDKRLPKAERKRLQIEHAAHVSRAAQQIKLGDKIANVRDVTEAPPADWPLERRRAYLDWAERVVAGCRGANPALERSFDEVLHHGRARLMRPAPAAAADARATTGPARRMLITRVVFSRAEQAAGDPVAGLKTCTGPEAEPEADRYLAYLVDGGPARWADRYLHVSLTLEDGLSWATTLDLVYTPPGDTVRSHARRSVQLEGWYGDCWDIAELDALEDALRSEPADGHT